MVRKISLKSLETDVRSAVESVMGGVSGTTVYSTIAELPLGGNEAGDQAYVAENNRLYLWTGVGWFNIALINTSPTITQGPNPSYVFATNGTPIVITLVASDPEGIPITWSSQVTSGSLGNTATISQNGNVFTITPSTNDADAGTFGVTFTASDGVNIATAFSSFTLVFAAADQFYNQSIVLTTSAVDNGNNNVFVDSSSNNFTITRGSATTQGSFSPYSPAGWSGYFDGTGDFLNIGPGGVPTALQIGSGDFTIEFWWNPSDTRTNQHIYGNLRNQNGSGHVWVIANHTFSSTSTLTFGTGTTNYFFGSSSNPLAPNQWHFVAFSRSGTSLRCFVNGAQLGTTQTINNWVNEVVDNQLRIGSTSDGINPIFGYLSGFRVIKGTALYTENFTPPIQPLTVVSGTSLLTLQDNRFIDRSTNNFNISRAGDVLVTPFSPLRPTVKYSPSVHGGSVFLPRTGTTGLLNAGTDSAFAVGTGDYTIESWVYIFTSGDLAIFVNDATGGLSFGINTSHNLYVGRRGVALDASTPLAENIRYRQWMHVAVSRSGTTLRFFVNGQLVSTQSNATNHTIAGPACIGGYATISGSGLNGYISGFRFVKGTAVYTDSFAPPTAPLEPVANTSLLLNFTNSNIFDETGKVVFETVGDAQVTTSVIRYGSGSVTFDGTGDYLLSPSDPVFDFPGNFTIEMWVNFVNVNSTWQSIVSRAYGVAGGWRLYKNDGNNQLRWYSNLSSIVLTTGSTLTNNTWHHIAVVRNAGTVTIFIDGINRGSGTNATAYTPGNFALEIGQGVVTSTFPMNGRISDLRITNGRARYTANFTPPTQKLGYNNAE